MEGFEKFCGGPFWNLSLTWNTAQPDFTDCFQVTAVVWLPCLWLWLLLPAYYYYLSSLRTARRERPAAVPIPSNRLNKTKTVLAGLLVMVSLVDMSLGAVIYSSGSAALAYIISPLIQALTYVAVIRTLWSERKSGFITSGVLFMFWLVTVLCGIIPFYTKILRSHNLGVFEDVFAGVTFYISYAFVLASFVLSCIADQSAVPAVTRPGLEASPEVSASFLSRIIYWWLNGVLITGYKKSLTEQDLWDLNPRDKTTTTSPLFEAAWEEEVDKCRQYNARTARHVQLEESSEKTPLLTEDAEVLATAAPPKKKKKKPSLMGVLAKVYGGTLLTSYLCKLVSDVLTFVGPMLQNQLIVFTEDSSIEQWKGWLFAALFLVSAVVNTLFQQAMSFIGMTLGMRIKAAVVASIYKKALVMSNEARKTSTVGEVVNLMSVDAQRLQDVTGYLWMLWSAPLQIGIAMYMLWNILGPSVLAGLGVLILLIPMNLLIAGLQRKLQVATMKQKDGRIKLMNEVLNGMKVLKLYAWELSFKEKIDRIRENELRLLKKNAYLGAVGGFTWTCAPFVVTLATFAVFVSTGGVLDAQKAFVSISLFNILRLPISMLPMILSSAVMASVSIKRVGEFLQTADLDKRAVSSYPDPDSVISIDNGTFSWGTTKEDNTTLTDVNMKVPHGSLVAVVGQVGCGKSSLISALLGEMEKLSGNVNVNGSVAYVAQQAWIQNATLKDNILFGKELDDKKYEHVLESCALKPDLEILPGGDQTEIGEKGINLSGGQKQRVSLARAVYNNADIYFLDDPLSAVDSHVGKHIFQQVISSETGILKGKTRVLVTHGIQWLPHVDSIIVIANGGVSEQGSYDELLEHDGDFAQFLKTHAMAEREDTDDEDAEDEEILVVRKAVMQRLASITPSITPSEARLSGDQCSSVSASETSKSRKSRKQQSQISTERSKTDPDGGESRKRRMSRKMSRVEESEALTKQIEKKKGEKLVQEETSESGGVRLAVFGAYLSALGYSLVMLWVGFFLTYQCASVYSNIWLSIWTEDPILLNASYVNTSEYQTQGDFYLGVYGALGAGQAIFTLLSSLVAAYAMVRASRIFHEDMLLNVLRSPMEFFDTTPMGRILNRFSRDIETVDSILPQLMTMCMQMVFSVLSTIVVISYSTPIFLAIIVPLGVIYYFTQRFYISTARQLKRVESTTRSPIYVHFSETVTGASTIRAYSAQDKFMQASADKVDNNLVFYFSGITAARWLGVRLEALGAVVVFAAATFAVLSRNTISGGLVGLSISYALQITQSLNWMVRVTSDLESNIVSVERVKEYSETPQEAEWSIEETRPPRSWPDEGKVAIEQYSARYREGLDLVLKAISADIAGGEKIGIVGRTGAGKSSLTLALFRLVEAADGTIVIDGIPIHVLGLHQLRSKLTILPQDPVLFSGTLRMNLDPFEQFSDTAIYNALRLAHLHDFVTSLSQGLDYECGEGGQNLSVGQRQLMCLARALLRKTKILILDEATAAVDLETDELIQNTIESEFAECTVITIAHRLNTIMDSTRVMVLDAGKLAEFDSIPNLLANKDSVFYGMAKESNLHHQQQHS